MELTTKKKGGMITRTGSVIVVTLALALPLWV